MPGPELSNVIRAEIEQSGPMPFERFMELALYAPRLGYYVREGHPFGTAGDFFTAEQLQPVFGILIAQFAAKLREQMDSPSDFSIVELGAGRGDMARALEGFSYTPVDIGRGQWTDRITGLVFANEFFDALPVRLAVRRGHEFRDVLVTLSDGRFAFMDGPPSLGEYLHRWYSEAPDGALVEIHTHGLEWLDRIAAALHGWLLIIDYGYTAREFIRYDAGTLMSYHRHTASPDVLNDPGNRDITAHVPFTVFRDHMERRGFTIERFETLASFLLSVGEGDQFAAALRADDEQEAVKRRMQLKTLLFGMGETFRVLVAKSATQ